MHLTNTLPSSFRRMGLVLCALLFVLAVAPKDAAADGPALGVSLVGAEDTDLSARVTDNDPNSFAAANTKQILQLILADNAPYAITLEWNAVSSGILAVQLDAAGNVLAETAIPDGEWMSLLPLHAACKSLQLSSLGGLSVSEVRLVATQQEADALYFPAQAERVDLMLIAAHTGDDAALFSELLPLVSAEDVPRETMTVFLSAKNRLAKREALIAQQQAGITNTPLFLEATYRFLDNQYADQAKKFWDRREMLTKLVAAIRQYRPSVIVTHDPEDTVDAMHRWTASLVREAVTFAADERYDPDSMKAYGLWQVQKLYVLEDGDDGTCTRPAAERIGSARREKLTAVLDCYSTIALYQPKISERCICRLDASTVGEDSAHRGLFENLPAPTGNPAAPSGTIFPFPVDPPQTNEENGADWNSFFSDDGSETVLEDPDGGHWAYTSDTLSVLIERHEIPERPLVYFVAHIRMRSINAYRSGFGYHDERGSAKMEPWKMARTYRAVLALTGDNLINDEASVKGILLRNGRIYNRRDAQATMALCPDMTMRIYPRGTTSAEELLAEGIEHTYGFGPVLVENGEYYKDAKKHRVNGINPRAAIGMVEPGHFVAIVVDGRNPAYSRGCDYDELAEMFIAEGCTVAYNMDGGVSVGMVFMGESINLHSSSRNITVSGQRPWPDGLLFGYSELVPSVDDPVYNTGNRDQLVERPKA